MTQTPDPTPPPSGAGTTPPGGSTPPAQPTAGGRSAKGGKPAKTDDPLRSSRTSGFYTGVIALGVLLILLIIFIVQNTEPTEVRYFGLEGTAPQAVWFLIAVAAGILLTAIGGSLRLLQVRRRVKRERKR